MVYALNSDRHYILGFINNNQFNFEERETSMQTYEEHLKTLFDIKKDVNEQIRDVYKKLFFHYLTPIFRAKTKLKRQYFWWFHTSMEPKYSTMGIVLVICIFHTRIKIQS